MWSLPICLIAFSIFVSLSLNIRIQLFTLVCLAFWSNLTVFGLPQAIIMSISYSYRAPVSPKIVCAILNLLAPTCRNHCIGSCGDHICGIWSTWAQLFSVGYSIPLFKGYSELQLRFLGRPITCPLPQRCYIRLHAEYVIFNSLATSANLGPLESSGSSRVIMIHIKGTLNICLYKQSFSEKADLMRKLRCNFWTWILESFLKMRTVSDHL